MISSGVKDKTINSYPPLALTKTRGLVCEKCNIIVTALRERGFCDGERLGLRDCETERLDPSTTTFGVRSGQGTRRLGDQPSTREPLLSFSYYPTPLHGGGIPDRQLHSYLQYPDQYKA